MVFNHACLLLKVCKLFWININFFKEFDNPMNSSNYNMSLIVHVFNDGYSLGCNYPLWFGFFVLRMQHNNGTDSKQITVLDLRNAWKSWGIGFYADISWESRYNIEINFWAHLYKVLLVFEVLYRPWVKVMPEKLKLPKVDKTCLKFSIFLWSTHWWNCLCETDWLGVGKEIKEILNKNELRLKFHGYILIPWKCPRKTLFQHTVGRDK